MIVVKLLGGLGNQMFQRAFGLALEARGYKVGYDKSALIEGTHREYSLGYFGDLPFSDSTGQNIYESNMRFNSINFHSPEPSTVIGYWQSEKYFKDIESKVRAAFTFISPYLLSCAANPVVQIWWKKIYNSIPIAVHVRRRDYVDLQHYHGMPSIDYYREAIKLIRSETFPFTKVFIFSDDPDWCQENFPPDFYVIRGTNKYEDLLLMASCKHIVIANSSFSWWGAWLGDNQLGRIVVAPKRWFADETAESQAQDIVPERWVRT